MARTYADWAKANPVAAKQGKVPPGLIGSPGGGRPAPQQQKPGPGSIAQNTNQGGQTQLASASAQPPNYGGSAYQENPAGVINSQGEANLLQGTEQNRENNSDYNSFGGGVNITYDANGQAHYNQTLSNPNTNILRGAQNISTDAQTAGQNLLNGFSNNLTDPNAGMSAYEKSFYNQQIQPLQQQHDQDSQQLQQTLAERGVPIGSDAYNNATNNFNNQWSQQQQQAANMATTSGQQQQLGQLQGLYGIGQQGYIAPTTTGFNGTANGPISNTANIYGQQQTGQYQTGQLGLGQKQIDLETQVAASNLALGLAAPQFSATPAGAPA